MAERYEFYVHDNRKITFNLTEPIMREDSGVTDFVFCIPKVLNGLEVSDWSWWLVFVNANKEKYSIALTLSEDPERPLEFNIATYTVDYAMSIKAGSVQFALEAINAGTGGAINNEWHTQSYEIKVKETLQGNQAEYAETESDVISALLIEVRNKVNQLVGGATPEPKNLIADMTDPQKVYLYVGSEDGESTNYWYYHNGTGFVPGGLYAAGVQIDATLTQSGQAADAKETGDFLNNSVSGNAFKWEIGTLQPGSGTQTTGSTRIRSEYIRVFVGEKITLSGADKRLLIYTYDENKQYTADTTWLTGNTYTVTANGYIRILVRKTTSNPTITSDEIEGLASELTIKRAIPPKTYTDTPYISKVVSALDGNRYLDVEIGSINAGAPSTTATYIRSKDYILANAGDVFTVTPKSTALYYGGVYLYSTNNVTGYKGSASFTQINVGARWQYTFTEKCYFRFRATNASSGANIQPQDLVTFNDIFHLAHMYDSAEFLPKENGFAIDYDALNTEIAGKFNIALQTDTHMSDYVAYTTNAYGKSDFSVLESVAKTINALDIDLFANLGDMVRGYQADPDFEIRATADKIIKCYTGINTNKAFVIGNHDDCCLFYHDSTYNDKQNITQPMFPNEQFNRYTKHGLNNMGVSNYYYADVGGVRVITLYQRDFDYSQAVPQIEEFNISTAQLNWLTGTALDTELPVIVLTHAPLVSSLYSRSRNGFDAALSALTSFVNGGGTVIAVLSGHTHAQDSAKVDGINHIVFKNGYDFFELISVDLTGRAISCKAINKSGLADMTFTY